MILYTITYTNIGRKDFEINNNDIISHYMINISLQV